MDLFLPNMNAELEVKVAGSEVPHTITVFGGENKVTFYITPKKGEAARNEPTSAWIECK